MNFRLVLLYPLLRCQREPPDDVASRGGEGIMNRRAFFTRGSAVVAGAAATGAAVAGLGLLVAPASAGEGRIPAVEVIDQDGRRFRFYRDLVRGRIVTLNCIFTSCGDPCPLVTQSLAQMRDILGRRVGRDIFMYSLTLQPEVDTPEVLRDYAAMYEVRPGWRFLTGAPGAIQRPRPRHRVRQAHPRHRRGAHRATGQPGHGTQGPG